MVYTIAAYSLTVGVLMLYGVIQQHRLRSLAATARLASGITGAAAEGAAVDPRRGINLGAALLAPFWMCMHGMRLPGAILIAATLALVPLFAAGMWLSFLFVALVPLAAGAALAILGNRIGVAYTGLEDPAAFSASQLPWALAGVLVYTVVFPWTWYFTYAAA